MKAVNGTGTGPKIKKTKRKQSDSDCNGKQKKRPKAEAALTAESGVLRCDSSLATVVEDTSEANFDLPTMEIETDSREAGRHVSGPCPSCRCGDDGLSCA